MRKLLLATTNVGKVRELELLLNGMPVDVTSLDSFPAATEVDETGSTFAENARLKAVGYAAQSGLTALADDSGLEIEALDGRPGVLSARYGGDGLSFSERMRLVLDEMGSSASASRRARFVCSLVLADPSGQILFETEGYCTGEIAARPRGTGGFGYDPIFIPDGFEETFGELDASVKRRISHRARAFEQIIPFLRDKTSILT